MPWATHIKGTGAVSTSNICCRVKLLEVSDAVVDNGGAADENS